MRQIVRTIKEHCGQCYSCVRNCPVKAVRIHNGQAEVIQERCIQCGNCVRMCSRQAKEVLPGLKRAQKIVNSSYTIALLAPSFPAAISCSPSAFIGQLKALGFREVWEAALGAELVTQEYQNLDMSKGPYISSACPAVVNLVERHYPQLIPHLVPVLSPAMAAAKFIRQRYDGQVSIVFIGPCISKKGELVDESHLIDEVLTFDEIGEWMEEEKTAPVEEATLDSPVASLAYLFPLRGGMLKNLYLSDHLIQNNYVLAEGPDELKEVFQMLSSKEGGISFVDALFCRGCIDGPGMTGQDTLIKRKTMVLDYFKSISLDRQAESKRELLHSSLDLSRSYMNRSHTLPLPKADDIRRILSEINKITPKDQLNCGACGYSSCVEKAIAVFQEIAEKEMCLPYLLSQKNILLSAYQNELKNIKELKKDLDILIDSSYDGIIMSDSEGKVERINKALLDLLRFEETGILDRSMAELERDKILYPSATLMVLREKKAVTFLQNLHGGKQVLVTGTPVFDENGNLAKVICNIRDFEELQRIKERLDQWEDNRHQSKTTDASRVIAFSEEFSSILEMAERVAPVDSTVLIMGESGTGKEVVARYIHRHSGREKAPFIKINCGALPETLIESELFGYETGAFTGAKRDGKPGLFELAHQGTIFLDEIGELPLSQQVKLLQVLQEKRVYRIGGTRGIDVDVRVMAATHRDLSSMVKEGRFRADLYYRLHVVPISIPPLRERKDDIIPLMYFFLEKWNTKYGALKAISEDVKKCFLEYGWPGNVRELENLIERLVVTSRADIIEMEDLPESLDLISGGRGNKLTVQGILPLKKAIEELERQIILQARNRYHSTYKIAEVLEVNQSTIVRKLKKYEEESTAIKD